MATIGKYLFAISNVKTIKIESTLPTIYDYA